MCSITDFTVDFEIIFFLIKMSGPFFETLPGIMAKLGFKSESAVTYLPKGFQGLSRSRKRKHKKRKSDQFTGIFNVSDGIISWNRFLTQT